MSERGEILTIYSESKRIKSTLEDLFVTTLDVNTNLQMWARGMVKYGDDFVFLKIDPQKGIVGCQQLPNIEIERIEGASSKIQQQSSGIGVPSRELRFQWKNKNMEFQSWEMAHFRLLGDDRKLPYGTSVLDKIRRIWKQLLLSEDAMLIYRTSRAPERRVFKIFVGNMDDKDIEPYVQRVANKFKRQPISDPQNGQVDMRFNQMPVWSQTPIPLLDGRTITIEQLSKEYDEGKENWVYSIQDNTLQVVPGKVIWCGKNYTAEKLIKIWLDGETWVMTAPEHPMILRDGSRKRADELLPNDSLMPLYTKMSSKEDGFKTISDYVDSHILNHKVLRIEEIYQKEDVYCMTVVGPNCEDDRHNFGLKSFTKDGFVEQNGVFTSNSIDQDYFIPVRDASQTMPIETLPGACLSLDTEIPLLDGRTLKLSEIINEWDNGNRDLWVYSVDPNTGESMPGMVTWAGITRKNTEVLKITLDNGESIISTPDHKFVHRTNGFVEAQNLKEGDSLMPFYTKEEIILPKKKYGKKYEQIWDSKKQEWIFTHRMVNEFMKNKGHETYFMFDDEFDKKEMKTIHHIDRFYNHKIVKIEWLSEHMDTGTITVDGNEIYHSCHTFACKSGVFVKNSNLSEIADIEYIQKKMLAGLRIPKAFLGFEEVVGDGKNLALMDIRFSRTINKIQKSLIQELNKIALIHLFLLGFEDELNSFSLSLTNPSSQSDLLKIEQWKEKITLYKDATSDQSQLGILPVSHTWAKKNILGMSDNEVILDLQQQRMERAIGFELTNTNTIIKRTRVFDEIDAKYGIPEADREKLQSAPPEGQEPGGMSMPSGGQEPGGGEPLSESKKMKILGMMGEGENFNELFDMEKAKRNIYEIEEKINEILND